jgi:hypothetical protein
VPKLQRPQNLWWFFHEHRKCPVVSPVLIKRMVEQFVDSIRSFAEKGRIPVVQFENRAPKKAAVVGIEAEEPERQHPTQPRHALDHEQSFANCQRCAFGPSARDVRDRGRVDKAAEQASSAVRDQVRLRKPRRWILGSR